MKQKSWWWIAAVVVLAVSAGAWWAVGRGDQQVAYRTAPVERGLLQAAVSAAGTVMAVSQVQVSSQVSGQIMEVLADFNSEVKRGQLIARLDPKSFEYRVQQASADVEAARAAVLTAQASALSAQAGVSRAQVELQQAERDLARNRDLVAQQFMSPAELERTQANVNTLREMLNVAQAQYRVAQAQTGNAEATVRQREAQLAQARVDLQRTQIRSPVDGIVIKRSIELGQTVAASLQAPELFVIARNLDDMQVEVPVDEADIGRVQPGQKTSFTVDAFAGRSYEGKVRQVRKSAVNTQNVITYTVVVSFSHQGPRLLPGMTANVRIVTDTRDGVLKVPNAALRVRLPGEGDATRATSRHERGSAAPRDAAAGSGEMRKDAGSRGTLHLLSPGEVRPRAVPVRVGISDGRMTEVLSGDVKEGDPVVTGVSEGAERAPSAPAAGPRLRL